jgi:hypothetical protein
MISYTEDHLTCRDPLEEKVKLHHHRKPICQVGHMHNFCNMLNLKNQQSSLQTLRSNPNPVHLQVFQGIHVLASQRL